MLDLIRTKERIKGLYKVVNNKDNRWIKRKNALREIEALKRKIEGSGRVITHPIKYKIRERRPENLIKHANMCIKVRE